MDSKELVDSPIFLSLPDSSKDTRGTPETLGAQDEWFQALHTSYLTTLRSLAVPLKSEVSSHDHEQLSSGKSIADSISKKLGFPKSPSQQLWREAERNHAKLPLVDHTEEEREERGFWAKRFKVVYEKMRQTYVGIPLTVKTGISNAQYYDINGQRRSSGTVI